MAEEIIGRLEGFSPSPGKLERDRMVYNVGFAVGRAGRCHRVWRWLCLGLGLTQILFLGATWFWLANRNSFNPPLSQPPADIPARIDDPPGSPFRPDTLSTLTRELDGDRLPAYVPDPALPIGDEPSLTAGRIPDLLTQSY